MPFRSIHRALVEAQAPYVEETLGNLAAYYAMLPGNSSGDAASNFNVRQFWLRDDHHANLALVFAPYTGNTYSADLEDEYLNVYETRTGTPFFLDPYVDGMRTTLILGAPRTGKSVNGNQIIAMSRSTAATRTRSMPVAHTTRRLACMAGRSRRWAFGIPASIRFCSSPPKTT